MNLIKVFEEIEKQYKEMYPWMQKISVAIDVLRANNNTLTTNTTKIKKRIARIEDKLNIVNVDEPTPLTEKQVEEIEEGD